MLEVRGWKNDELKGKNKEIKGVFVFGSSFSGPRSYSQPSSSLK